MAFDLDLPGRDPHGPASSESLMRSRIACEAPRVPLTPRMRSPTWDAAAAHDKWRHGKRCMHSPAVLVPLSYWIAVPCAYKCCIYVHQRWIMLINDKNKIELTQTCTVLKGTEKHNKHNKTIEEPPAEHSCSFAPGLQALLWALLVPLLCCTPMQSQQQAGILGSTRLREVSNAIYWQCGSCCGLCLLVHGCMLTIW